MLLPLLLAGSALGFTLVVCALSAVLAAPTR